MEKILSFFCSFVLPAALTASALFFLFYLKGYPFRRVPGGARGGNASSFRAVTMALAGTLGVGNITGVADAVMKGGAGVLFWMWISSLAAMVVKYAEIVLLMRKCRAASDPGAPVGPTVYMRPAGAAVLFALFGLLAGFTVGSGLQATAVCRAAGLFFPLPPLLFSASLGLSALFFILRGKHTLFALTSVLVPAMSFLYVGMCLAVIVRGAQGVPSALFEIFRGAFGFETAARGCTATAFCALRFGVIRGLLSNEAGCGTAPIAHAHASALPERQGKLGVWEVAVDTLLLCTLTGLTLLLSGASADEPTRAVGRALSGVFGRSSGVLLTLALFVFAFATLLCWSVYLDSFVSFLFRRSRRRKAAVAAARILFCLFACCACFIDEDLLWTLSDLAVCGMTLINLIYLFVNRHTVRGTENARKTR